MTHINVAKDLSLIANESECRKPLSLKEAIEWMHVEMPNAIDHTLAIGYGIHYTDQGNQDKFLALLDKDAEYRELAMPIIEAAKHQMPSKIGAALNDFIESEHDIKQNLAIIFWAIYLSEQDEQSAILRELERKVK